MLNFISLSRVVLLLSFFTLSFYFNPIYNILIYLGVINALPLEFNIYSMLKDVNIKEVQKPVDNKLLFEININKDEIYSKFRKSIESTSKYK
jgi:hypothetical protein